MGSSSSSSIPKSLFGYDVIDRIGEGAASMIYAVSDPKSGQLYALKHVVRASERHDRFIQQLENELAMSEKFRHPVLRKSIEIKYNRTLLRKVIDAALIMELVDGVPLDRQPPKKLAETIELFLEVSRGLAAMHYLQLVHCDLKPSNILTSPEGGVKIIDFGQACKVGTVKERVQGTPDFISPEQCKLKPVTIQTDVFNFGATLYWGLTTQRIPTLFTTSKSERDIVKESKFPTPRDLNPEVPKRISDMVMDCVKMEPLLRPGDMGDIQRTLEAHIGIGRSI